MPGEPGENKDGGSDAATAVPGPARTAGQGKLTNPRRAAICGPRKRAIVALPGPGA